MITQHRTRTRGGFSPVSWAYVDNLGTWTSGEVPSRKGQYDVMSDLVTKPFVAGKTIVNSPMSSSKVIRDYVPVSGSMQHNKATTGIIAYSGSSPGWGTHEALFDSLLSQANVDVNSLITQASTQALAGVKKPELSGFVSLAEARSTIQGLLNPINGALKFLGSVTPSKKRRNKKTRVKTAAGAIADQHLSIIFGLLPFISDVQSTLKALQAIEPLPVRFSSRGSSSSYGAKSSNTDAVTWEDSNTRQNTQISASAERAVSVRAYVLYETSIDLQTALGLSLSDIPKAVWQTTTLSFVIDWFANVGDFISAITPVSGVSYLASGITITTVDSCYASGSYTLTAKDTTAGGWNGSWTGGSDLRLSVTKTRQPGNLASNVGLSLKRKMHNDVLDTFKITAGLSLITQRLTKFL